MEQRTSDLAKPPRPRSDLYRVHPLLDPRLPARHPALARLWLSTYRRSRTDRPFYERMMGAYCRPIGLGGDTEEILRRYFRDADAYLDDLLRLAPRGAASQLACLPETRQASEMLSLLARAFEGSDRRARFEAQRKLYLAKLLFDVDHCRTVQDGPRHQRRFEAIVRENLWVDLVGGKSVEVCCRFDERPGEEAAFLVGVPDDPGSVCWRFEVRKLRPRRGEAEIEIYDYRSRFKREVNPARRHRTEEGYLTLAESPRWPSLGRRSGSIASKMLRRGIGDPRMVEDLLGAMFIVGSRSEAYALERRLIHLLGGPLRWRDRIDTLSSERDRGRLDKRSSSAFRVLKGIVDILTAGEEGAPPYFFSVEVQIFPLEDYIRTLHARHFASHAAYKKRQFLHDLLPLLFPSLVYGKETAHLAAESR